MCKLILAFCCCIAFLSNGQRVVKEYYYDDPEDWISVTLTLASDSTFLWRSANGYGDELATGTYKIKNNKLTLLSKAAYKFYQDAYRELIFNFVIDSCCHLTIMKNGISMTRYQQTFFNAQAKADSCILNNMLCVLKSSKFDRFSQRMGFHSELMFTSFTIKDKHTIALDNKELNWTLKSVK